MKYFLLNNQDTEDIFLAVENLNYIFSKLLERRELSVEFFKEKEVKINKKAKLKNENKERREKFIREQKKALEQDYEDIIF